MVKLDADENCVEISTSWFFKYSLQMRAWRICRWTSRNEEDISSLLTQLCVAMFVYVFRAAAADESKQEFPSWFFGMMFGITGGCCTILVDWYIQYLNYTVIDIVKFGLCKDLDISVYVIVKSYRF
ncbi:hypothetical protein RhiirA5_372215 [Rhizophagus irregularis]|uniref:Uncharacterized protein n=1 Tax=Rhizophagus irregularis TaxID=588596 RepID=A0A2N0Q362_9GLOM|nr:hypothetical protein RhiirA5_372215 [Rhizophagus irregularis]